MATGRRSASQITLQGTYPDRVDEDFETFIDYDDKAFAPMAAWLNKKGNSEQKDTDEFTLFSGELIPRAGTLTQPITTTDATGSITISGTDGIVAGTILHVGPATDSSNAGDLVRVDSVTDATSITFTRLTTDYGIPDDAPFIIIGNVDSETSTTGPASFDMEPASVVGYMSILKRRIDITITERNSAVRGAPSRLAEKMDRAKKDFLLDQEHQAWFSRKTSNVGSNAIRTSMGIHNQIATTTAATQTDGGGTISAAILGTHMSSMAAYLTTSTVQGFMGKHGMNKVFQLATTALLISPTETSWGSRANSIPVGPLTLELMYCRVFDIVGTPYDEFIFTLDISQIKNVHLKEGKARLQRNVQSDSSGELESHQFRAQCGVSITTPKRHGFIYDTI